MFKKIKLKIQNYRIKRAQRILEGILIDSFESVPIVLKMFSQVGVCLTKSQKGKIEGKA